MITKIKMLRYYGIYAHNIDRKLEEVDRSTWAKAVEHSFACTRKGEKNPEICPNCSAFIIRDGFFLFWLTKRLRKGSFKL